jgi:hypothetical protein
MPISTSTTEPAIKPLIRRHTVRAKGQVLVAIPVVQDRWVNLPNGEGMEAGVGDWLIARGEEIVDVASDKRLHEVYEPAERVGLILQDQFRFRAEKALGIGSTETPEMLCAAIERLARLKVGDVEVSFTPGQWEHLAHRAGKMGISTGELVRRIAEKISQDIWVN